MREYAELPWSVEDTIENLKSVKNSMKERVILLNLHGRGEKDAEEVEFDFGRAIDALERQEKYRWHDLRKNPDDLPKRDGNDESDYVLVLIGKPEWNHWEQAYYNHAKHMWSTYEQNVIGWKAIEPFEKEVE